MFLNTTKKITRIKFNDIVTNSLGFINFLIQIYDSCLVNNRVKVACYLQY